MIAVLFWFDSTVENRTIDYYVFKRCDFWVAWFLHEKFEANKYRQVERGYAK